MTGAWLILALAGVFVLPHTNGPRWLRWLGRALAGTIALGFSAAAIALFSLGSGQHWTGDGPGMLVVMMLIPVAAVCALAGWVAALRPARVHPGWMGSPAIALGMIVAGSVGCAAEARQYQANLRPAHGQPVVALAFVGDGRRLVSCDAAGALSVWDVPGRERAEVRTLRQLAGAAEVRIARDGRFALALGADGVRVVSLDAGAPAGVTLSDVTQAAFVGGDEVALATATEVRIAPLASPGTPRATRSFEAGVSAVAAHLHVFVALGDGALVALGDHGEPDRIVATLPFVARRLLVSPKGKWLVALDAEGRPAIVPSRGGDVRQPDAWLRMHAVAFVSEQQLVFTTSAQDPSALAFSLERLETEPFFNHGRTITALAALPGAADAALALGGDLHLVRAPVSGLHAYASQSVRLVNPTW